MPNIILASGSIAMNKTDMVTAIMKFTFNMFTQTININNHKLIYLIGWLGLNKCNGVK